MVNAERLVAVGYKLSDDGLKWELTANTEAAQSLTEFTKAELVKIAEDRDVELNSSWTKAEIIEALEN